MSATLTPFFLQPSNPGTRQWLAYATTNYNSYVFVLNQVLNTDGTWSGYVASWSTIFLYYQTVIYGPRPPSTPHLVPGNPFVEWADVVAACEVVVPTLT
jgi:hypothetical protein